LLEAIVIEDQGKDTTGWSLKTANGITLGSRRQSQAFFEPEIATNLLAKLNAMVIHNNPIPTSQDIPVSTKLEQVLGLAHTFKTQYNLGNVEPLHLLYAALSGDSTPAVKVFLDSGITPEKVLIAALVK